MKIKRGELTEDELLEQKIEEARERRFRKAMALKTDIGLTDEERHSLAQMIPSVDKDDGGSWKELNPAQLRTLINMLEGYLYVKELMEQRPQQDQGLKMMQGGQWVPIPGQVIQNPQGQYVTYTTGVHAHTINTPLSSTPLSNL